VQGAGQLAALLATLERAADGVAGIRPADADIPGRPAIAADHEGAMRAEILEIRQASCRLCVERRRRLLRHSRSRQRRQQRRNRNDQTFHALPPTTEASIRP
jgi:hypothetical protein